MRSVRYEGSGHLAVADATPRSPGPGEVQVEVAYTGICGTDLHILQGHMDHRVSLPAVIGHEMSGRVAVVGEGVSGWEPGDPVTVMPLAACGDCPACRAGNGHICHDLVFIGIDAEGSMQSRWTVPADTLLRLPRSLPLEQAALVEPVAVAVHDVGRAGLSPSERVLVVGGGPVGLLISLVARLQGADVLLSEPDPERRSLADQLGLATLDPRAGDVGSAVTAWSDGAGADVAFEVSGATPGLADAVASLSVRGRLVLVAIHPEPREVDLFRFFWRELTLIGARLYTREDFERAVELVGGGELDVTPLISRVEPMDAAASAFEALRSGGAMKVLIDCQT